MGDKRLRDLFELSLHDSIKFVECKIDAMIGDPVLRKIVGADSLGAIAASHLRRTKRCNLLLCFAALFLCDLSREKTHCLVFIFVLASLFLAIDNSSCRDMGDTDSGVGCV